MGYTKKFGSETAKGGFKTEKIIADIFCDWEKSKNAQDWLSIMGYDLEKISKISARAQKGTSKVDLVVDITLKSSTTGREKISLKSTSDGGPNQVGKRSVDYYADAFGFKDLTRKALKKFCGVDGFRPLDLVEKEELNRSVLSDLYNSAYHEPPVRLAFSELEEKEKRSIREDFLKKKDQIVKTVLAGRGMEVGWFMVAQVQKEGGKVKEIKKTRLEPIGEAIRRFSKGGFRVSSRGSCFFIGGIYVKRKSGTPDPEKLQFMIKDRDLWNYGLTREQSLDKGHLEQD